MLPYILFLLVVFITNLIQMIGGFAGTMIAMPLSLLLIGAGQARVVLNAIGIVASLFPLCQHFKAVRWREVARIILFMLVGVIAGQFLFSAVRSNLLLFLYSILILLVALRNFLHPNAAKPSEAVGIIILLAAGLIHGIFLSGGALLVIYAMQKFHDKNEFRASLSAVWVILNSSMIFMHTAAGLMTRENLMLIAVALIPTVLGVLLGEIAQRQVNGAQFRRFANFLLMLSGLTLLGGVLKPF